MRLQFIDKRKEENLQDGVEFYACGLVLSDHTSEGRGNPSGKDYAVGYLDPWGEYQSEWRSVGEVVISYINDEHAAALERAYARALLALEIENDR
jgi:hypothetical protein